MLAHAASPTRSPPRPSLAPHSTITPHRMWQQAAAGGNQPADAAPPLAAALQHHRTSLLLHSFALLFKCTSPRLASPLLPAASSAAIDVACRRLPLPLCLCTAARLSSHLLSPPPLLLFSA